MQRIMSSIVGLAGICLLAACQSPAGQLATVAPAASVPLDEPIQVAGVDEEIICRSMKVTGTRFQKRECKTVSAWEAYDTYTNQNAKESTDNFQRLNSGCSTQAQGSC